MANIKFTDLSAFPTNETLVSTDIIPIVDLDDQTMGEGGTNKTITASLLSKSLGLLMPENTINGNAIVGSSIISDKLSQGAPAWDASGNFFIGNASQSTTLVTTFGKGRTVIGSSSIQLYTNTSETPTASITKNSGLDGVNSQLIIRNEGTSNISLVQGGNGHITLSTANDERLRVTAAGKVGILKSDPSTELDVAGTVTATSFSGPLTGNASTATALENARTIAISGAVTGTATSFNGSANITIATTLNTVALSSLAAGALPTTITVSSDNIVTGTIVNDDINSSAGIVDTKLATISSKNKVSNSATTATSSNTNNAIVARDASGDFSAGKITASLVGNADTATKLASAKTISLTGDVTTPTTNPPSFDGSANFTVSTTIANNAVSFSKIAKSATAGLSVIGRSVSGAGDFAEIASTGNDQVLRRSGTTIGWGTIANSSTTATDANTNNAIVARDASGNFASNIITANSFRARGGGPGASGASNNGYSFSGNGGDTDSGMFSSSDGNLEFYTDNKERMRLDASGRLLFGLTSGGTDYGSNTIVSESSSQYLPQIYQRNTANDTSASYIRLQKSRGTAKANDDDSLGTLLFEGHNGTAMIQAASIGAAVDGTHGQVATTIVKDKTYKILSVGTTNFTTFGAANNNVGTQFTATRAGTASDGTGTVYDIAGDVPARIVFSTRGEDSNGLAERVRIDSAGNVGIGTTTPNSKLHVHAGDVTISRDGSEDSQYLKITSNSSSGGELISYSSSTNAKPLLIQATTDTSHTLPGTDQGSSFIYFKIYNSERMRIASDGNVGIGTTTPKSKLDVTGGAILTKNIPYAHSQDAAYLIAGSTGYSGATSNWGTYGFQHRFKSNSGGSPRITVDAVVSANTTNELVSITSSGVGINTSDPKSRLDVNGAISVGRPSNHWSTSGFIGVGISSGVPIGQLDTHGGWETTLTSNGYRGENAKWVSYAANSQTGAAQVALNPDGSVIFRTQATKSTGDGSGITERMRIDNAGRTLFGATTSTSVGGTEAGIQLQHNIGTNGAALSIARYNNDTYGSLIALAKSRKGTPGTPGAIVQNGDTLGFIGFAADDGTDLNTYAASISVEIDGTPGANDMPGRIKFSTTSDGASSPTERMRIDSAGNVGIGKTAEAGVKLDVSGDVKASEFIGPLTGDVTGNASSATKVSATAAVNNTATLVESTMANNDFFRILTGGSSDKGYVEIATADGGSEPIYVRQYQGGGNPRNSWNEITRTATLLDDSGNTSFPGTVTATGFSGTATNSTKFDNVETETYASSLRANVNITGGGTISVATDGSVKWTQRFIVIANGCGSNFATNGNFDMTMPAVGTVITGVGSASNVTVDSAGIAIPTWGALYYILPIGSTSTTVNANFRVVGYSSNLDIPHNWVLICVRNSDSASTAIKFSAGYTLNLGESIDTSKYNSLNVKNAWHADIADNADNASAVTNGVYTNTTQTISGAKTFTGTTVLPAATSIGNVSSTEIGYLDGVTSSIQAQFDILNEKKWVGFMNGGDTYYGNTHGLSAYGYASMYIGKDGEVRTAGYGEGEGLGNGSDQMYYNGFTKTTIPFVDENEKVTNLWALGKGNNSAYALTNKGRLFTLGYNGQGQLGVGDKTNREIWVEASVPGTIVKFSPSIGSEAYVSCFALNSAGELYAWGDNGYGQLGVGDTTDKTTPTRVNGTGSTLAGKTITDVFPIGDNYSNFNWTFVRVDGGRMWAAGYNGYGQLGVGDKTNKNVFTQTNVDGDYAVGVSWNSLGSSFVYRSSNGVVYATGYNAWGQLGQGNTTNKSSFAAIPNSTFKSISVGGQGSCIGIGTNDKAYAWGLNDYGQLGTGDKDNRSVPTLMSNTTNQNIIKAMIAGGPDHTSSYLLRSDGMIFVTGYNGNGELGRGNVTERNTIASMIKPARIKFKDFAAFGKGSNKSFMAVDQYDNIWACGYNGYGQCGFFTSDALCKVLRQSIFST